ncbi:MAG: hypothetical protein M1816_007318 [Peltula sp. TS41687]|nr:MAG: hypothetical protein M1816_007318 [Peltula sp. TS41687]
MASTHASKGHALHENYGVDYVISFRFSTTDQVRAEAQFEKLVHALANVGLATEARDGGNSSVLLFLKPASEKYLASAVYRSRIQDWLHGIRHAAPDKQTQHSLGAEAIPESEKLRILYQLITNPTSEGGAGITPKRGEWTCVESIFPLHDHTFNKEWIKKWSSAYLLNMDDLDQVRNRFGEKVSFYFAFLQNYFTFLFFPAAFGFSVWVLLGYFSAIYGIAICLWSVIFIEYWKKQEADLAIRWATRGVSTIQAKRHGFQPEKEIKDPVTHETVQIFPATKRFQRQLLQVPFTLVTLLLLGSLIAICFGIEVFISEVYGGPFKSVLVFLPTGLLTTLVPTLSTFLTQFATRLTDYENWETEDSYQAAMTQKIFVLNFITSYLPIFLTAFVYVPFGSLIVPYLDVFSLTVKPFAEDEKQLRAPKAGFEINPARLRKQVIYFTVTAQVVNLAMEVIVPYIKRKGFRKMEETKSKRATKRGITNSANPPPVDHPEEAAFLQRVRNEAELDTYDVTADLREMVLQFGYLSMFSVVWPLAAISFLINDWIEMRADAIKITVEMQRPIPWRADSIGPWLDNLGFLSWTGSLTTSALVYLFSGSSDGSGPGGSPSTLKGWALLLTVFFSEHLYFLVRTAVRTVLSKLDSEGLQKERRERYMVRKKYLEESIGLPLEPQPLPSGDDEQITRLSLEEQARRESLMHQRPEDRFWGRQRYAHETAEIGVGIIRKGAPGGGKKSQ